MRGRGEKDGQDTVIADDMQAGGGRERRGKEKGAIPQGQEIERRRRNSLYVNVI